MIITVEQLARLPCCALVFAAKGQHARYLGDTAIRHYQDKTLLALLTDLGIETDEATIQGGIGTLILARDKMTWLPAATSGQMLGSALKAAGATLTTLAKGENPLATQETIATRRKICESCPSFQNNRCMQCGCNTTLKTTLASEHCPLEKW